MIVRVLLFGPAKDAARAEQLHIELPTEATISQLKKAIVAQAPSMAVVLRAARIACNRQFVADEFVIKDGDELAIIPPVSGGSGDANVLMQLMNDRIADHELQIFLKGDPNFGGIVTFEGITRAEDDAKHGRLVALDYEAYPEMAMLKLNELAERALSRWGHGKVVLVHRLGRVSIGETSVFVGFAAGHRAEAFEACRWLIDQLKLHVPIWKRDLYEDGFVKWVEPTQHAK